MTHIAPKPTPVLQLIGNTPMIRVRHMDTGVCELYLKLENQNPGGSIKDRIALSMVEAAEREGHLKPGGTLVEATAGNTGLALALIAVQKGYRLIVVMPDKMSQEKVSHLRAMGAEVVMTRSDVKKGDPEHYHSVARDIADKTAGAFYIGQFDNPNNPLAHERSTAPEIWEQMDHKVDAIVCGVGTGGTLTGISRFFQRVSPTTQMVLADPKGSILTTYIQHGVMTEAGSWLVEGIGEDYIPSICDLSHVKHAYTIPDDESFNAAHELLLKEGIFCGSSTGTQLAAALRYAREQTTPKRIVTFVCDSGAKYMSKMYNPSWLQDNGFTEETSTNDLRDLIARPFAKGKVVTVAKNDTLKQVYAKMKQYDISQAPVMEDGKIVGIINETDVLLAVVGNPKGFSIRVGAVMSDKLVTTDVAKPITDLLPIFERGMVACIMDKGEFLGLITPIDFLNYLRKRTGQA